MKKYLVWYDYGYEGWTFQEFDSLEEAQNQIKKRPAEEGRPAILTQVLPN